jgi:hypothetical protein
VPRNGLDVTREIRRVAQGLPESLHSGVHAVLIVDVRAYRPEPLFEVLAGDHLAGALEEQCQDAERLAADLKPKAVLS